MEKIAIISDIHGSYIAACRVIEDIKKRGIKRIFCLGDLVAKGSQPNDTVELIKKNCEVVVKGNCDDLISSKCTTKEHFWNHNNITKENLEYLDNLPLYYDFYMSGLKIRLIHASTDSLYKSIEYYNIDSKLKDKIDKLFENSSYLGCDFKSSTPDIVIFGHIHSPFVYRDGTKIAINPGSVSNGCDVIEKNGNKYVLSSYLIIEGDYNSKLASDFEFEIVKLPYDYEKEIENLKNSDMPNKEMAINELESGIYVRR